MSNAVPNFLEIEWDDDNLTKIFYHKEAIIRVIWPHDVECAVFDPDSISERLGNINGEERSILVGASNRAPAHRRYVYTT